MDANLAAHIGAILACFFGSCFFSGTETALTSLSQVEVERLANSKNWWKSSLSAWVRMPNRLLATNLLGNTMVNVAAATVSTSLFATRYPEVNLVVVTSILTLLILIFGEIAPKMIARTYALQIAPISCRILIPLNIIFYPVTHLITRGVVVSFSAIGIKMPSRRGVSGSDIEAMVLMAGKQGSMEQEKQRILSSVFQFSKRRVKDIMIPKDEISAVSVDADLIDVLDLVRVENHSRYPVYKKNLDRIIGFLHARDLFGVLKSYGFSTGEGQKPEIKNFSLRTCLRRAFFVSEQAMISTVLNEMKKKRIHLAIVKDEWGNVVGLVTLEDILEEVFGEIEDEHDEASEKPLVDLFEAGVEVDGDTSLGDLHAKYDIEVEPGEGYSSVNGFLQHYASYQQLTAKTVIIWKNYVFSILSMREGEIERVRITQVPDHEDDKE